MNKKTEKLMWKNYRKIFSGEPNYFSVCHEVLKILKTERQKFEILIKNQQSTWKPSGSKDGSGFLGDIFAKCHVVFRDFDKNQGSSDISTGSPNCFKSLGVAMVCNTLMEGYANFQV